MANLWLRLYSEFATDPKVQVLTEALQRRYVMLLCMQCNDQYFDAANDEIALYLRISIDEWELTKKTLIERRLLNEDGSIHGWDNRQFISDLTDPTAAERQRRYRDKKRNLRNVTGSVTDGLRPDTDTDTDSKPPKSPKWDFNQKEFSAFWESFPKKKNKGDAEKAWKALKPDSALVSKILAAVEVAKRSDDWLKDGGKYIKYPASWLRAKGWEDEQPVTEAPKNPDEIITLPDGTQRTRAIQEFLERMTA